MSQVLTLELPDELVARARSLASATNRRLEDALVEWIGQAVTDQAVESLPDVELLALCEATLDDTQQAALSDLLQWQRERRLNDTERQKLDALMLRYRRGLVFKGRALKEAVARGLKPPLSHDAA